MIPRCEVTNKIKYPSWEAANAAIDQRIQETKHNRDKKRPMPTGCYECEQCSSWHLTHCNRESVMRRSKKNDRARRR